jgi:hypothetical protein
LEQTKGYWRNAWVRLLEIDNNRVKQAIMRMKYERAAGPGDTPIELIKSGSQKLLEMITILFNKMDRKYQESGRLLL